MSHPLPRCARVVRLVPVVLAAALGASCAPSKAGDACDLAASEEPCPEGLVCQDSPTDDGDGGRCLVVVGASCAVEDGAPDDIAELCADGTGCGEGDVCGGRGGACDAAKRRCAEAQVCADVDGGGPTCFPPVHLRGAVVEVQTAEPIPDADVIAVNADGAAITPVATSDADGAYVLEVPAVRNGDGSPVDFDVTLRASAQDHETFPGGLRAALPIGVGTAEEREGAYVVENALTTVALLPLPDAERGRASVSGRVDAGQGSAGVLVVAEGGESASAVSDADGTFRIFNVAPGAHTVRGYAQGLQLVGVAIDVGSEPIEDVVLVVDDKPTRTVTGSLQMVNAPGGALTSVVLVAASTFDPVFARGEAPRGLRAEDVASAFTIEGVPDGDYYVLAAFEDDELVRDPDEGISGTDLLRITVSADLDIAGSFKVTEALAVVAPGADGLEITGASPTFVFASDSSEDFYEVTVIDAFGALVWSTQVTPPNGSGDVSVPYAGPPLEDGMVYQFRAVSVRDGSAISSTEDLQGVFEVQLD